MSKSKQLNVKRRLLTTFLLAGVSCLSGCASSGTGLASLNPFATNPATPPTAGSPESGGLTSSFSNLAQGTRAQASSMGMAVKSAYGKSRDSIAGLVGGGKDTVTANDTGELVADDDPLRIQNTPTSVGPEVFVANGQLWETTGNLERAMDNYSKALESEPTNGAALASVARLHFRQQNYDKSVEFFQRAIKSQPNEAGLYNDLGLALSKLDRHDEALTFIERAIAIAPATSRYANNLATVQFEAGQGDAARNTLLKHNSPVVAHYNMAYLHYSNSQNDKALQELGLALSKGETAGKDSASQSALKNAKLLFDQLGGPATQLAKKLPQAYSVAKESGQAIAQVAGDAGDLAQQVRGSVAGVTAQLTDTDAPPATQQAVTQQATPQQAASPSGGFALPPEFTPSTSRVAETPGEEPAKF